MLESGGSQDLEIYKLIFLSSLIILMIIILVGIGSWVKIMRLRMDDLSEINWEEEKKKLEELAVKKISDREKDVTDPKGGEGKPEKDEEGDQSIGT